MATTGQWLPRGRGGAPGGSSPPGTLSVAVLALVMCLLVLGVAGAIVLRWGLREETDKRATTPPPTRRARRRDRRPVRSGVLLVVSILGIGVVTGVGLGLVIGAAALALRSLAG
ncbi:MAG: hypothetical protein JWO68_2526 [Actinomycetia bacterium]|nr:hypothetical protein [Actinomycetes bacterium]